MYPALAIDGNHMSHFRRDVPTWDKCEATLQVLQKSSRLIGEKFVG